MIDIENRVFTMVYNAIMDSPYSNAYVDSEIANVPPRFPAVYVIQTDSFEPRNARSSSRVELFNHVTFDIEVYSNKASGKKSEAKAIMKIIDDVMRFDGFRRTDLNFVDLTETTNNTVVARLLSRYTAEVDSTGRIYSA